MGKVIKGWDEGEFYPIILSLRAMFNRPAIAASTGVPQLSLGQKAVLTCTPDYVRSFISATHSIFAHIS